MSHHHTRVASFAKLLTAASETVGEHPCGLHCSPQGLFLLRGKDGESVGAEFPAAARCVVRVMLTANTPGYLCPSIAQRSGL